MPITNTQPTGLSNEAQVNPDQPARATLPPRPDNSEAGEDSNTPFFTFQFDPGDRSGKYSNSFNSGQPSSADLQALLTNKV